MSLIQLPTKLPKLLNSKSRNFSELLETNEDSTGLEEVESMGMGMVLIRTRCLQNLPSLDEKPWFFFEWLKGRRQVGDLAGELTAGHLDDRPPVGQVGVVVHGQAAVRSPADVELDAIGPDAHHRTERVDRVLGREMGCTAVADHLCHENSSFRRRKKSLPIGTTTGIFAPSQPHASRH